jgi:hypothetical protein
MLLLPSLRRSPRLWYQELVRFLASIAYPPIEADPCVFINTAGLVILAYVDDLIFITLTRDEMAALSSRSSLSSSVTTLDQSLAT